MNFTIFNELGKKKYFTDDCLKNTVILIYDLFNKCKLLDSFNNISIIYITNKKMIAYNKKYKGINETTDVLTFPFSYDNNEDYLGEIVINIEYIMKHYANFVDEFALIIIHGILHLLKYNHIEKKESKIMFDIQEKIYNDYLNTK